MSLMLRKLFRDLNRSRTQTFLVIISIAVGLTSLGLVTGLVEQLNTRIMRSQTLAQAASVRIALGSPIDDNTLQAFRSIDGVVSLDGFQTTSIRWRQRTDAPWRDAILIVVRDFNDQRLDRVRLVSGRFPNKDELVLENNLAESLGLPPDGANLWLEVQQQARPVTIVGRIRNAATPGPPLVTRPILYVTRSMMEPLGLASGFNDLRFTISPYDEARALAIAQTVEARLKELGVPIVRRAIEDPSRHPVGDVVDGIGFILRVIGIATVVLSVIILTNNINTTLIQQLTQIAVMKTYGADRWQLQRFFLSMIGFYALISLLISIPLAIVLEDLVLSFLSTTLNLEVQPITISAPPITLQVIVGIFVPLLASWRIISRGIQISIRDALGGYGIGQQALGARVVQVISRTMSWLPLSINLTLRNLFRFPGRTLLTGSILTIAGTLFIMMLTTEGSFRHTAEAYFGQFNADLTIELQQFESAERTAWLIESYPGIAIAEVWNRQDARLRVDTNDERDISILGYPSDSAIFSPQVLVGNLPDARFDRAILLNVALQEALSYNVGDSVTLEFGDNIAKAWQISGFVFDIGIFQRGTLSAILPSEVLGGESDLRYAGNIVYVKLKPDTDVGAVSGLLDFLANRGIVPIRLSTLDTSEQEMIGSFQPVVGVLLIVTILVAIVGNIALSGLLSITVIERRREIGVMRSLGANSLEIGLVFVREAVLLALLSSGFAVGLSLIISQDFVVTVFDIIQFPGLFVYNWTAVAGWFIIAIFSAIIASWFPVRRAAQISIRESIAYE